ncbi:MAG: hypothetical protein ACM3Q2_03305 [Syntrophothermus sp.]
MSGKKELSKQDIKVKDVKPSSPYVEKDENKVSRGELIKAVDEAGYKVIN